MIIASINPNKQRLGRWQIKLIDDSEYTYCIPKGTQDKVPVTSKTYL